MTYIDAFLAPVQASKKDTYLDHAKLMGEMMKEFGALAIMEHWGDDIPEGTLTSLPLAVKLEPGEAIALSWAVWPSKDVRDAGWAAMMEDPRMKDTGQPMPFDGKRLIFGGFERVLEV